MESKGRVIEVITRFLIRIGIDFAFRAIEGASFMPGVGLKNGIIIIHAEKLTYPSDILHEAGQVATAAPDLRKTMNSELPADNYNQAGEIMSQAWCYAACLHIGLDPTVVFHASGYKGEGDNILQNFTDGYYIGLPMLQYLGLACNEKKSGELNVLPYPNMIRWLREA